MAAKRSHEDDDTSSGESDGTSGSSASTESVVIAVPEKRRRRGAFHKPRKNNPLAFIQLGPALHSELNMMQQVSLLLPHNKTSDVARTARL